jgi:hypothetical protein
MQTRRKGGIVIFSYAAMFSVRYLQKSVDDHRATDHCHLSEPAWEIGHGCGTPVLAWAVRKGKEDRRYVVIA